MQYSTLTLLLTTTLPAALAICPGFNYGIGNAQKAGKIGNAEMTRWNVYDSNCKVVDGLLTNKNPCTSGTFSCSPPPIIFNGYTSSFGSKLRYKCRKDGRSGRCGNDSISVCCRNDGN